MRITRDAGLLTYYAVFGFAVLLRRGRPTHRAGVAARGTFTVHRDPKLKDLPFFDSNRKFAATVRHGNVAFDDDAAMDLRGCALQLADPDRPSEPLFDLVMNTGEVTFSTAADFLRYTLASGPKPWNRRPIDEGGLKRLLRRRTRMFEQYTRCLRRAPTSFAGMHYYSKLVYRWRRAEGQITLLRFRIRPADAHPEQGIPSKNDLGQPWNQDRSVGEQRPYDYLRTEFVERMPKPKRKPNRKPNRKPKRKPKHKPMRKQGATYYLEAQMHDAGEEPRPELEDPGQAWDHESHPWLPLGSARLDEYLHGFETEALRFNIGTHPPFLSFRACRSMRDFGSIPFIRTRIYRFSQRLRWWISRLDLKRSQRTKQRDAAQRSGPENETRQMMRNTTLAELVFAWVRW